MTDVERFSFKYFGEMRYLCMKNIFYQYLDLLGYDDAMLYLRVGNEIKIRMVDDGFTVFKHFPSFPFFDMDGIKSGSGKDADAILQANIETLPLITLCDVFYLPYRKEYLKYHAVHAVIFYDYCLPRKEVGIVDWYEPHFFRGYIPIKDFIKARSSDNPRGASIFSGYAVDNFWYKIDDNCKINSIDENYQMNVKSMLDSEENRKDNVFKGKAALAEVKRKINTIIDYSEMRLQDLMELYHNEFFMYYRTMTFGSLYYKMISDSVKYVLAEKYSNFCKSNADILSRLNMIFTRASLRPSKKYVPEIIALIDQVEKNYQKIGG